MSGHRTQRDRILDHLRTNKGRRVASPELGRISLQYGARVKELRDAGYSIRNEVERVNGQVHGYFILEAEPEPVADAQPTMGTPTAPTLFSAGPEPDSTMLAYELGRRGAR